jgi:hypothetical protein
MAALRRATMEGKDWTIAPVFDGFVARRKDASTASPPAVQEITANQPAAPMDIAQAATNDVAEQSATTDTQPTESTNVPATTQALQGQPEEAQASERTSRADIPNELKPDATPEQIAQVNEAEYQQSIKDDIKQRLGLVKPVEEVQKKTPFKSFLREHGINPAHTSDIFGKNRFKANNILPATFRGNGLSLDDLAERALERGFMTEADAGDTNKLISLIQSEVAGDTQVSSEFADEDAAAQTERVQRLEIEGVADSLGLPFSNDISTDRLASMVNRVSDRVARAPKDGLLKPERILKNALDAATRIEQKRAQLAKQLAEFDEATIQEQDALIDLFVDEDGNAITFMRTIDTQTVNQWFADNPTWTNENATDTRTNQDAGQTGAPVTGVSQEGSGNGSQVDTGTQPASAEKPGAGQEGLTAPTRADVLAQQERTDNAQALDDRAQIDAEASRQTLTQQTAPEQRTDTSGDMFAVEKAQAEIDKRNAGVAVEKDPNQPGMFDDPTETKAQGTGDFGPILTQFRHDAQGAIKALTELQNGEAVAALQHPEVGDIDLVWGKAGTKESNGSGLAKLVKWHPEVVANLQDVISSLKVVERTSNRIQLESETHKAAVRLEWNGTAKKWLLTAFEKRVVGSGTTTDTTANGVEDDTARLKSDEQTIPQSATESKSTLPAWHTAIPAKGIAFQLGDEKVDGSTKVLHRIAKEAVDAITQAQNMNGGKMYAYVLPSTETEHGAMRLFPEDQTPPSPWQLADNAGIAFGFVTKEQLQSKLVQLMGRSPVLSSGDHKAMAEALKSPPKAKKAKPATPAAPVASPEALRAQADLQAALADLGDIFGQNTRLNMMPEQEAKILPVLVKLFDAAFRLGYHKFKDAAKFALDKIRAALGDAVADDITLEHLQGAYISMSSGKTGVDGIRAVSNIEAKTEIESHTAQTDNERNGETDVPSTNASVERDSPVAAPEPAVGDTVQNDATGTASRTGTTGGRTTRSTGRGQQDGAGVSTGRATAAGERGDQRVPDVGQQPELADIVTGADFREPGGDSGITGVPAEPIAASQVDAVADKRTPGLKNTIERNKANKAPFDLADLDSIKATLPQLLPGQQEDVKLTEIRFAKPEGYGMLFTNGTGTGKTFSGLGVIKRNALQGKTNTLIVAPDSKIASDWVESGKLLGLDITQLADTKDSGKGIVITTYANLGANDQLASRQWELVVADEAHSLMQAADGEPTGYLYNLRAITYHPDGAHTRHNMLNRDKLDRQAELGNGITALEKMIASDSTTMEQRIGWDAESEKLQAELGDLRKELAASMEALRAEVDAKQGAGRTRLLALSATPFAYEKTIDWANGYLFDYNDGQTSDKKEFRGYNSGSNKDRYFMQHFGYSMRVGKLTRPDANVDAGLMQRQWNSNLKKTGALSGRMLDVAPDYDRRFILVDSAIGNRIDEALEWISEQRQAEKGGQGPYATLSDAINEQFKYQAKRYLLEAIKADAAIPIVKAHMALGRKVIVFHDYKKGGGFNPFNVTSMDPTIKTALEAFNAKFSDLVSHPFADMPSPIDLFSREIPGVLLINGDEKKADLLKRYKQFQDDSTGPLVMLVQSAKNKGWSGHDTTGVNQRVLMNLGQPTAPTLAIQQEGRAYRTGQATDAIMRYMNTGTNWERWTFASTIATRASTAENLGMGEMARALKDSFIQSFEESDTYEPGHEGEGKGGKERDKAANDAITEYDRAKTFYFGQQKKNSRTKAQEGADYFATPEPVGLKMVQWLDARGGESVMEPSAGHGAIARWLPDNTSRTAVEPSFALRSKLALVMEMKETGDRILSGTFEDHHVSNKYDGIVMNPPFGTAGRTAVDHLAKAATHLRDGGRIVALLPDGPSANAKFDKWFFDSSEKPTKPLLVHPTHGAIYKGDTITSRASFIPNSATGISIDSIREGVLQTKVTDSGRTYLTSITPESITSVKPTGKRTESFNPAEGLSLVATIKLPTITFERAGTAVATRIVVIEKSSHNAMTRDRDYSDITDIKELFDKLENLDFAARTKPVEVAPVEPVAAEKPAKADKPAKVTANAGDEVTIGGTKYEIEIYTTNAGKEKRGVWMASKADAMKYSARAFTHSSNKGKWFVDEYWFPKDAQIIKPDGDIKLSRMAEGITRREAIIAALATAASGQASADTTLGKAKALSAVMGQQITPTAAKILRGNGATNPDGATALRTALQDMADNGPAELRPFIRQLVRMLPRTGFMVTVDDKGLWNAHGAVRLKPIPQLMLFTAEGRTGLTYETLLHETLHLIVAAKYHSLSSGGLASNFKKMKMSNPAAMPEMEQLLKLWQEFGDVAKEKLAGITDKDLKLALSEAMNDPDEFFVRALTEPRLQQFMAGIEYKGKTLLQRFKDWVKTSLFGFKKEGVAPSWLDAALMASNDFMTASEKDPTDFKTLGSMNSFGKDKSNSVRVDFEGLDKQFQATADAAGGIEAYSKARDSGKTVLTYKQWVQVRTPNFKKWWGYDWESEQLPNGSAETNGQREVSGRDSGVDGPIAKEFTFINESTKEPRVFYHGTRDAFTVFDPDSEGKKDHGWLGRGHYVSSDHWTSDYYSKNKKGVGRPVVMELFARPNNPKYFNQTQKNAMSRANIFQVRKLTQEWRDQGHNGAALHSEDGTIELSVYDNNGLKSATDNTGLFGEDGDIRYSRTKIIGETTRQHTPAQLRAMKNVGFQIEVPTLKERAQAIWKDAGKKLAQGIVDQFAPVKALDGTAYGLLRLAKGASGAFESLLHGGMLKLSDNVYDFDDKNKGGVIDKLMMPLQGEHHDFMRWVAANRAERLMGDGKEHLFTPQDVADLKTLATGQAAFDYKLQNGPHAGQTTRDRAAIYRDSLVTFNAFNKNVLDMAEQSGLIDPESRKVWEHEFYVPFYRVADDADGGVRGMNIKGGVVRQQAFKTLKGGKNALNADLLDNTLMNWAHLLDASAKNRAAKATIEAAERMGVAIGGNQTQLAQMGSSVNNKNGVVWFMDGGIKRYSLIDNQGDGPFLMTALTALEFAGMRSPIMNAMGAMKHALTIGVTASPFFKVRNLIRDSVQVIGTSGISANAFGNVAKGWKLTDPKSDEYFRLLAGGGTIHFGSMLEGSEAKRVQSLVESGVDAGTILGNDHKVKAFYRKFIEPGITAYNELGNRGEAVNRASLYDQLVKQGMNHAEASLQARDLMDFSMQGSFTSIRFLTQVVPFFNARLQGMYKLGRSAKEDPARLSAVIGASALISVGLLAAFGDDDDWKKREDWDRNNYWWFKLGGTAFRIPKPFEIGAVATLAERGFELAFDKEMTGTAFRKQVMTLLGDNLSMNPIPQVAKPMLDVYSNKNSFSGAPIESLSMERLKSEYRFNDRTSMTARGLSTAANTVTGLVGVETLSPVQIDHMLRGYFGWLGSFVVGAGDKLARPLTGQNDQAAGDYWKTATGGMVSDLRDAPSRYVSNMYDQAKEIEEAYGTWRALQKQGDAEGAKEFKDDHATELAKYHQVEAIKRNVSKLNERVRVIERSDMTPDEKREKIRTIQSQKARIAMRLAPV